MLISQKSWNITCSGTLSPVRQFKQSSRFHNRFVRWCGNSCV